jgi:hypothetical protein
VGLVVVVAPHMAAEAAEAVVAHPLRRVAELHPVAAAEEPRPEAVAGTSKSSTLS